MTARHTSALPRDPPAGAALVRDAGQGVHRRLRERGVGERLVQHGLRAGVAELAQTFHAGERDPAVGVVRAQPAAEGGDQGRNRLGRAQLGDPRTARAAAALATNELRVAYALHPVRLLAELRAPEAVPALITTLRRRLRPHDPYRRVALACVEGLGELGDPRAESVLNEALAHPALAEAAVHALARIPHQGSARGRIPGQR